MGKTRTMFSSDRFPDSCCAFEMRTSLSNLRIGVGHDTHRLGAGGPLLIGGVEIDFDMHLIGHSDADVLLHAITDAILGAAALGDIGDLFPNDDERNRDRSSTEMLQVAHRAVGSAGFRVLNLDCIVFAQQPKLSMHKMSMRKNIGAALGVALDRVGLKAKTGEGVDAVGQQLAVQAQCVALLEMIV